MDRMEGWEDIMSEAWWEVYQFPLPTLAWAKVGLLVQ